MIPILQWLGYWEQKAVTSFLSKHYKTVRISHSMLLLQFTCLFTDISTIHSKSKSFLKQIVCSTSMNFSTLLQAVITGGMGQRCTQKDEVIVWHHADHLTTALATSATGGSCGLHRSKAKLLAQLTSCLTCMSLLGSGFTFNNLDRGRTSPVLLGRALLCSPHPL